MKKLFSLLVVLGTIHLSNAFAVIISVDKSIVEEKRSSFLFEHVYKSFNDEISIVEIKERNIPALSYIMHQIHNRCGGFFAYHSLEEAFNDVDQFSYNKSGENLVFADYSITEQELVNSTISKVQESRIRQLISHLSGYHNRFYKSQTGVQSSNWIAERWKEITAGREDASVDLVNHSRWPQPSVVLTIKGKSDETIIIGGHADSIAGYWGRSRNRAPGADDNASGIATVTEIIQSLVETSYQPEKTLKFMAYAAEEVGLLGSREIAESHKRKKEKVIGVLQLDMTNFKGSPDKDIVLISDNTNLEQNAFLGRLIDEYIKLPWSYDKCGYGCSDHASWTRNGFPASFPFEAKKAQMNRKIHTANDTIEASRGNAAHAAKFAKLGLSFLIELDR